MDVDDAEVLRDLLARAGLGEPAGRRRIRGRGFENAVSVLTFPDGTRAVLRRFPVKRRPEWVRAAFLESHEVPAPRLLAASAHGSLYEHVDGVLLGDLIESGKAGATAWRLVGAAYRRTHDVVFPPRLTGLVEPDRIVLRPVDPVAELHRALDGSVPGASRKAPRAASLIPRLHELVDRAAGPLRDARTALGHGDINMWNVIVGDESATLIDWDTPTVRDPALELALLDKHASLFNGRGLGDGFRAGYGEPDLEPNRSLHRVIQTLHWAASLEYGDFVADGHSADLLARVARWRDELLKYVARMPEHVFRLERLLGRHGS